MPAYSTDSIVHAPVGHPSAPGWLMPDSLPVVDVRMHPRVDSPLDEWLFVALVASGLLLLGMLAFNRRFTVRLLRAPASMKNTLSLMRMESVPGPGYRVVMAVLFLGLAGLFLHAGLAGEARPDARLISLWGALIAFALVDALGLPIWTLLNGRRGHGLFYAMNNLSFRTTALVVIYLGAWLVYLGRPSIGPIVWWCAAAVVVMLKLAEWAKLWQWGLRSRVNLGSIEFFLYICTLKFLPLVLIARLIGVDVYGVLSPGP